MNQYQHYHQLTNQVNLALVKNSEMAKEKDQQRHKGRDKRHNIKNHFLTADGEDI